MTTPDPVSSMDPRPCWVRISRRIDASPGRVHRAWSDPEEMASWFPRQVEGSIGHRQERAVPLVGELHRDHGLEAVVGRPRPAEPE